MTFRDRMRVPVSKAEIEILKELTKLDGWGNTKLFTQERVCLKYSTPDFTFRKDGEAYLVFIDAFQTHKSATQLNRDIEITEQLGKRGYKVLRCHYKAPLTQQRRQEIVREICTFIGRPLTEKEN